MRSPKQTKMPSTTCCVPMCSERGGHVFPKDKTIRKKWLVAIKRDKWNPTNTSVVCSSHFTKDDYVTETFRGCSPLSRRLKKVAYPTQFAWTKNPDAPAVAREQRAAKRRHSESLVFCETPTVAAFDEVLTDPSPHDTSDSCQIGVSDEDSGLIVSRETQTHNSCIATQERQSQTANQTNAGILNIPSIMNDDDLVHFYTGLESYRKFSFVLSTLGPCAYCLTYVYGAFNGIEVEKQFLLVLMKLRRHTTNCELSKFFGVSELDVYNIFCTWIRFMALQWREIDMWPSRDVVRFYSPSDFKAKYPTTRIILDGTEIPVHKPSLPLAQQATYSTYKNRNTVKVVVGSTPGGLVTYVSQAYGGATSDRHIIERSNVPSNCDIGDSVMADKGFDVQDIFAPYDVKVNIPSFFRKQNQMQTTTVLKDRKIVSKRVHIERLIGLGKTYKILTQPLNQTETLLSSDISFVCFVLCNFRSCIVPTHA